MKTFDQFVKFMADNSDHYSAEIAKINVQNYCFDLRDKENELCDLWCDDTEKYGDEYTKAMDATERAVEWAVSNFGLSYRDLPTI